MMNDRPRGEGWRGRKRGAWMLLIAAWVAMTVGLFLPSYTMSSGFHMGEGLSYPGWECAWTVTWIWKNVIESGVGDLNYGELMMLSYLPINALFLLGPLCLWMAGRTRRLSWVLRVFYTLIMLQVLAWWILLVLDPDHGTILIGYWFWLAAYVLLAAAFWVMPKGGTEPAGRDTA